MTSFLRRLFGKSTTSAAPVASPRAVEARPSRTVSSNANMVEPMGAKESDRSIDAPPANVLRDQLRKRLDASLHQLDDGLIEEHRRSTDAVLLMRSLRNEPLGGIRQLPVAAQRALALLHGDAPTNLLVDLFENDPAITQALLLQVNSAYYNPSGAHVVSLTDGINRMGRAGVQGVVLQQSVSGMVSRPGGDLDAMAQQVWNHMVRVAPLARELAPAFGVGGEQAFLLGLLHDVGKLVVFDRISELRSAQRRALAIDRPIVSRALRLLHEPLGGLVVQQWGLDGDIARAIGSHHREPTPAPHDALGEVIYVAERVDLARERKQPLDLAAIWHAGALSGDRVATADVLGVEMEQAAA